MVSLSGAHNDMRGAQALRELSKPRPGNFMLVPMAEPVRCLPGSPDPKTVLELNSFLFGQINLLAS